MAKKSIFNWSGGKDSAMALHEVRQQPDFSVGKLLTTMNKNFNRISMHGVREQLLDEQAKQIGIPLQKLKLPDHPTMTEYNRLMDETLQQLKLEGYEYSIFGDIFLEDLRKYREEKLKELNFKAHFPIWGKNTTQLIHEFLEMGFKTIIVSIKADLLDKSFAGRIIDNDFLKDLPSEVDPCGENGEFHTFVFDGPIFKNPIQFEIGEKVYREYKAPKNTNDSCAKNGKDLGFWFCDLLPK